MSYPLGYLVLGRDLSVGDRLPVADVVAVPQEWRLGPGAFRLCGGEADSATLSRILILANEISDVPRLETTIQNLVAPLGNSVSVSSASDVVEFRGRLAAGIGRQRRSNLRLSVFGVLGSYLLMGVVVGVSRRQGFGRRRALGASRADLLVISAAESLFQSGIGAALATVGILAIELSPAHPWADLSWLPWMVVLSLEASVVGILPVSLFVAFSDPVEVLRRP